MALILILFLETSPTIPLPGSGTPVWVPLLLVGLVLLIFWWGMTRGRVYDENFPAGNAAAASAGHHESPVAAHESVDRVKGDLELIEGIGPVIAQLLAANGIDSFPQLAHTEVETLAGILREAGINLADPETWPEQAQLAAAGQWDQLANLQGALRAGRRPS